ncbi:hypothetical protein OPV22_012206 [Ensete ventricosum]|uniref:DUF632 domain-containing protein n=1 Tax=Ensete ventricosum TaxID=4639 RepID=A0AAV8QWK6_ENSVE|nr:hypothetical protein OPV22_012206 [Ensete ventricosum]RWW80809.1 hypothetical protein BHE74_00010833 [Ensete ventricosum]
MRIPSSSLTDGRRVRGGDKASGEEEARRVVRVNCTRPFRPRASPAPTRATRPPEGSTSDADPGRTTSASKACTWKSGVGDSFISESPVGARYSSRRGPRRPHLEPLHVACVFWNFQKALDSTLMACSEMLESLHYIWRSVAMESKQLLPSWKRKRTSMKLCSKLEEDLLQTGDGHESSNVIANIHEAVLKLEDDLLQTRDAHESSTSKQRTDDSCLCHSMKATEAY